MLDTYHLKAEELLWLVISMLFSLFLTTILNLQNTFFASLTNYILPIIQIVNELINTPTSKNTNIELAAATPTTTAIYHTGNTDRL